MLTPEMQAETQEEQTDIIYCQRRNCPGSTGLRCYQTNVPICMKCAVRTPVGYISKDAAKMQADRFFNIRVSDYVIAAIVAFGATLFIGFPVVLFLGRIWYFMFFLTIPIGGAIGEMVSRSIGNRRGRYTSHIVATAIVMGVLPLILLNLLAGLIYGAGIIGTALSRLKVAL